ncbi:MAG: ComF family protein [Sedimentisphaerales bacterium]|nr:ComF family protein [Sedimentisphaerales bacterium]
MITQKTNFLFHSIIQLFWPAVCINCNKNINETENNLCKDCWNELIVCTGSDYCTRCGKDASIAGMIDGTCPDCQGKEIFFDGIARAGIYAHSLQNMILAFKNGKTELDFALGFLADSALQGSRFYGDIDFFVPVPLHWTRRLRRGYNQSKIIAGKLKHPTAKINTDLVRIRKTKMQPTMPSPAARTKNVAGAFAIRYRHNLSDKNICLIDDIKTTGATLNECARILIEAGANKVFALVLAVAGQKI